MTYGYLGTGNRLTNTELALNDLKFYDTFIAENNNNLLIKSGDRKTVNPVELIQNNQSSNVESNIINSATEFRVTFFDPKARTNKTYYFSLLPAIETNLRTNNFGATVPEIKPGILIKTSMNVKKFNVPGSAPAVQSLGISQSIIQLVGLFLGTEGLNSTANLNNYLYGSFTESTLLKSNNSYTAAKLFESSVVKSGVNVNILIRSTLPGRSSSLEINYTCLIQDFRLFVARDNRTYYAIDALVTKYG